MHRGIEVGNTYEIHTLSIHFSSPFSAPLSLSTTCSLFPMSKVYLFGMSQLDGWKVIRLINDVEHFHHVEMNFIFVQRDTSICR